MRVTKEQLRAHREGIVTAAGRLFRSRGVDAVPVAEVMQAAGLTHGGFYGHYASKAALAADACQRSLTTGAVKWRRRAAQARADGGDPLSAIIDDYLSAGHVEQPQDGCALAALSADAWRAGPPLNSAMTAGFKELRAAMDEAAPAGAPPGASLAALATMVGAVALARACEDRTLVAEMLAAARAQARRAFDLV